MCLQAYAVGSPAYDRLMWVVNHERLPPTTFLAAACNSDGVSIQIQFPPSFTSIQHKLRASTFSLEKVHMPVLHFTSADSAASGTHAPSVLVRSDGGPTSNCAGLCGHGDAFSRRSTIGLAWSQCGLKACYSKSTVRCSDCVAVGCWSC